MSEQNKTWETPQLIILARGMPEENVLLHCKQINPQFTTAVPQRVGQDGCDYETTANCGACQSRGGKDS